MKNTLTFDPLRLFTGGCWARRRRRNHVEICLNTAAETSTVKYTFSCDEHILALLDVLPAPGCLQPTSGNYETISFSVVVRH